MFQGPGVCGDAFAGEAAFIAHADGVRVVVLAMRACLFQRASAVYFAVACDIEMIAYVREAAVADVVRAAGFEIQVRPSGVAEQWIMMRVMVLMGLTCRRSGQRRR